MVGTILLIILFVLCVLLLIPVRAKASFGDGKWAVSVYYLFFRVFHKESQEKPPPETPPKPGDLPEGEAPPEPKPEPEDHPKKPKKKPAAADPAPKPETVTAKPEPTPAPESKPEPKPESPKPQEESAAKKPEKPEKPEPANAAEPEAAPDAPAEDGKPQKKKKRGFIERLKPHSLSDVLGLVQDGCAALSPALKFLTKHLHFRHLRLYLAVASDDPANTATLYGKICAAAYNLLAALQCWVDIETDEFRILANFYNEKITFRGALELRVSPMAAILLVLILGIKFLWRTLCRFRREDQEAKRREKETAPLPQT